jgi:tRNA(Ile)-lysidine synthase
VLEAFREHIATTFPNLMEGTGLVACSAGIDSVVLVHLCAASGISFSLVHCNFHLRGEDSEKDAVFVEELAAELGLTFFKNNFDTTSYAREQKLSIQMAARELRYGWFKELMREQGAPWIMTGHHLDDALETFLINLSRGTGIDGLSGIPQQADGVIRPLLPFSREQIINFAKDKGITWREDLSNEETKYLRNKIRHELVPVLKELHPSFLDNFRKTQHFLSDSSRMLFRYTETLRSDLFLPYHQGFKIPLDKLKALDPPEGHLFELLKPFGFTSWGDITALLNAMSGKEIHSRTHRLIKDRKYLLLQPKAAEKGKAEEEFSAEDPGELPVGLKIEQVEGIEEKNNTILYLDKETLNHKLTVRKWKKGDYFYPLGMDGKKKVAKFFKDEKMDAVAKENQWLLCCGEDIVWIIGRRADNRFKITAGTKTILKITLDV